MRVRVGRLNGNAVEARTELVGLPVRYSLDSGQTWSDYKPGRLTLKSSQSVMLVAT